MPRFSIIVPVYNRPAEVKELVESLALQTCKDFELLIVEDGSTLPCSDVIGEYEGKLPIRYFFKENGGRSRARNYGMERARGDYLVFFDSDCVIPPGYFRIVKDALEERYTDSYGGPDRADESFTTLQKAISFSMTSFLTTGGIRGSTRGLEKFTPRTFNMGFSMEAYRKVGGFKEMFGEDIDLSLRLRQAGYTSQLIPGAFVYHKRRVDLRSFYRQVHVFGMARVDLLLAHPGSLRVVHLLPSLFLLGSVLLLAASIWFRWASLPLGLYFLSVFTAASLEYRKVSVGALSVATSAIQLFGYGYGFIKAFVVKILLKRGDRERELDRYYKKK